MSLKQVRCPAAATCDVAGCPHKGLHDRNKRWCAEACKRKLSPILECEPVDDEDED